MSRSRKTDSNTADKAAANTAPPSRIVAIVKEDGGRKSLLLRGVRASYVYLRGDSKEKTRSNLSIIIDPEVEGGQDAVDKIDGLIREVIDAGDWKRRMDPEGDKQPLKDGDDMKDENYEGKFYFNAAGERGKEQADGSVTFGTPVFGRRPDPNTQRPFPIEENDPEFPQSGDYVNVTVSFWAQDQNTKQGVQYGERVNCRLEAIQLAKKGESLSGRPSTSQLSEDFEADVDAAGL